MSLSLCFCSRCTAGHRHDGAKLPRCASSSTACANRLWWPACDRLPCLCRRRVQKRLDFSLMAMLRCTALPLDAMRCSQCTDRLLLARAAGCHRSLTGVVGSIGQQLLSSREAVKVSCRAAFDGWLHGHDGVWTVTALLLLSMLLACEAVLDLLHGKTGGGRRGRLSSCGGVRWVLNLTGVSYCSML